MFWVINFEPFLWGLPCEYQSLHILVVAFCLIVYVCLYVMYMGADFLQSADRHIYLYSTVQPLMLMLLLLLLPVREISVFGLHHTKRKMMMMMWIRI
jgi:hypothetical protein